MPRLGKKKGEYLSSCRRRIEDARRHREQEGLDDLWERLRDLYRGKHFPDGLGREDRIAVNIAFSTINVMHPAVSINYPKIVCHARKPEDQDRALIVETLINYWWTTFDIHPEFRLAVIDFLIYGFGWLKTGYRYVEEEANRDPDEVEAELANQLAEADSFAYENPDSAGELPTDEEIAANVSYTTMRVVDDRPFVERLSVHDVFVDPRATTLRNARWIAQRCVKTLAEVKGDERYSSSVARDIKPDLVTGEDAGSRFSKRDPQAKDSDLVTVWEFYDLRQGTMCVFAAGGDGFLVEPMPQPYSFGHPFVMLRNHEVPDQFYPMGELEPIEGLQHELNKTRSQMMNDRKRYARKYLAKREAFSPDSVAALRSQKDNEVVFVNEGYELGEAIVPMPQTQLDASIYQQSAQIESDMNTITGVSEYARGGGDQAVRRTATEASIIQDAANSRAAHKLGQVESVIGDVARRLVQLAQQYLTEDQVVRVTGANNRSLWFQVEPTWIRGEYDFEVVAGSTRPIDDRERRDEALGLLQVLGPFMDPALGMVNVPEVLRYVLQYGFAIRDAGRFLGQGPQLGLPPEEAAAQQPQPPPGGPPPEGDAHAQGATGGVPPEILAQLSGQVGLNLPSSTPA